MKEERLNQIVAGIGLLQMMFGGKRKMRGVLSEVTEVLLAYEGVKDTAKQIDAAAAAGTDVELDAGQVSELDTLFDALRELSGYIKARFAD